MNYQICRLLNHEEVRRIAREMGHNRYVDGKLTAFGRAKEIKHNLQVDRERTATVEADKIIVAAFSRSQEFQNFAMPQRFVMPIYSRYEPGMEYGPHVDNSLMGGFNGLRADLAMTLFLSEPSSYDGGELVIHLPAGREEIKLDCGEAVVYPASSVHHVAPVTRGIRLGVVTWIQSIISDERMRATLFDLAQASKLAEGVGNNDLCLLLTKSYHNLIRYAAQP
jgi:PKHD-type hydroxylase